MSATLAYLSLGIPENNLQEEKVTFLPLTIYPEPAHAIQPPNPAPQGCFPTSFANLVTQPTIPVRKPTVLPIGYKLQAIDHEDKNVLTMYYWDKPMCPFDISYRDYVLKGAILIAAFYNPDTGPNFKNGTEYTSHIFAVTKDSNANYRTVTLAGLNGNIAVGTDPFTGKSQYLDASGNILREEPLPAPGLLYFFHETDKIEYLVEANMPLNDIIKVAESLR